MQLLLLVIIMILVLALCVGLVRPSWVKMSTRKRVVLVYGLSPLVVLVLAAQIQPEPPRIQATTNGPNHIEVKRQVPPQPDTEAIDVDAALKENQKKMAAHRASKAYKQPTDRDVSRQQAWIFDNCIAGTQWDYEWITKAIGAYKPIEYTGSWNPNIVKALYFYDADMTIFYNSTRNTIVSFTTGKKGTW